MFSCISEVLEQISQIVNLKEQIVESVLTIIKNHTIPVEERFKIYVKSLDYLPRNVITTHQLTKYLPNATFYYGTDIPEDSYYRIDLVYQYSCDENSLTHEEQHNLMEQIMRQHITHLYSCEMDSEDSTDDEDSS
jgi:hypothetical protein